MVAFPISPYTSFQKPAVRSARLLTKTKTTGGCGEKNEASQQNAQARKRSFDQAFLASFAMAPFASTLSGCEGPTTHNMPHATPLLAERTMKTVACETPARLGNPPSTRIRSSSDNVSDKTRDSLQLWKNLSANTNRGDPNETLRKRFVRSYSDKMLRKLAPEEEHETSEEAITLEPVVRRLWGQPRQRRRGMRQRSRPKRGRDDWNYWRLRRKQRWLIPAEHPLKLLWDIMTVVFSIGNAYATHSSIRDRQFGNNFFVRFCEVWFVLDILFNFVTEYKCSDGMVCKEPVRVWARYLATWFVIDAVSLFPGELLYIQPIIDKQNQRGFFQKSFFRTKAVIRVTRVLRGRHFRLFGNVAKQTKRAGFGGASRLLQLIIKYVPKYLMFLRNMKAVILVRLLRQIHWVRKIWLSWRSEQCTKARLHINQKFDDEDENDDDDDDDGTQSLTDVGEVESFDSTHSTRRWEYIDDLDEPSQDYHEDDPF